MTTAWVLEGRITIQNQGCPRRGCITNIGWKKGLREKPMMFLRTTAMRQSPIDATACTSYDSSMSSTIAAPVNWVEAVGNLHFPSKADRRLQELMDRNNEGLLGPSEREELEALVELSEQLSLVRGEALQILGKRP